MRLPALAQSASAGAIGQRPGAAGAADSLGRPASQADLRSSGAGQSGAGQGQDSPTASPAKATNEIMVKFRGDHGLTFEATRVTGSVLQAWMLGVRPGWTVLQVANQPVQTKEDIEELLQQCVEGEKRYEVLFQKNQGKFGTEAKEKAEKEKRQLAKLRKEFKFQGAIERIEHRSANYYQLERVYNYLEENCSGWVDHLPAKVSKTSGRPLRMDFLNFHHLTNYIALPLTRPRKCSLVEMLAANGQPPSWFLSHWWGSPVITFMECLKAHITTRNLNADTPYWIWACACRHHQQRCEITEDPKKASFSKALDSAKHRMLVLLDPQGGYFKRTWCLYEAALCLDQPGTPLDLAVFQQGSGAELITHGMTEQEEKLDLQNPGSGIRAKAAREASFPVEVADAGLVVQIENTEVSKEDDRALLLRSAAGMTQQTEEPAILAELNARLRALFAAVLWSRVTVGEKEAKSSAARRRLTKVASALRKDASRRTLEMHTEGLDSEGFRLLSESLPPGLNELSLSLRCSNMKNEDVDVLAKALPKNMKELRLDFTGCRNLADAGVAKLAGNLNFEETAVYLHLEDTGVSKDVQDHYAAEAQKNEENGANGQLKNVSRALGVSLCREPLEEIRHFRQKAVPAVTVLGKVLLNDSEDRALAALRAIDSFGEKARQALTDEALQRAKELELALLQAEADRKAREAEKKAKEAEKKAKAEAQG